MHFPSATLEKMTEPAEPGPEVKKVARPLAAGYENVTGPESGPAGPRVGLGDESEEENDEEQEPRGNAKDVF